jgi:hypothetical protein
MAGINEEARIPVYINDEQAKSALKNLTAEAEKWRKAMYQAMASGDLKGMKEAETQLKKTNRSMADLKKSAFDVDAVMKNISSASARDLRKALQAIDKEMDGINRNTKEYQALANKKLKLKDELGGINNQLRDQGGVIGKLKNAAGELLPAFGWGAIAAGATMAFSKIVNATDTLSTQWEIFTGGLREGMNAFWRTIAEGDWSNFFTNIDSAIKRGREYQAVLDGIDEMQRGLTVQEAATLELQVELEEKVKNKTLSNADRIKAAEERIQIEKDLAEKRKIIAKDVYDNEMKNVVDISKLSAEEIEKIIMDFDSPLKQAASELNDLREQRKNFDKGVLGKNFTEEGIKARQQLNDAIAAAKPEVVAYADELKRLGITSDEQMWKLVNAFKSMHEAAASEKENVAAIISRMNSLIYTENKKGDEKDEKRLKEHVDTQIKTEAEAQRIILESIAEGERLMLEGASEEYEALLKLIGDQNDLLNNELENRLAAATPIDPNFATLDQQQAFFDARIALIESQYQKEKALAGSNQAALLAAEQRHNQEIYQVKSDQIDAEYALIERKLSNAQSYIAGLAGFVDQESKLGKALFLFNQALAIGEVWVNIAKANAKAVAFSPMTFGQPWVTVNTGMGIKETALIAAQTVGKFLGKKAGGFTDRAASDNQVADYVHANEFVASAPAVRNPTVKPVLDIIDIAQRTGRIANLNLPAALGGTGRKEGGYSGSGSSSASSSSTTNNYYQGDTELKSLLAELREMMKKGVKAKMYYRDFEDYEKEVEDIRDAANL